MRAPLLAIAAVGLLQQPARGDGVPDLVITLDAPELAAADASSEFPVVTDGVTEDNWAPVEAGKKPTVQLTNMPQNKFKLSTTEGAGTRTFARPTIIAGNASVVSPTVLGRLRRGGEVKEAAAELIVKYNCIAPGSSTLKAVLPFANPDEGEQDKIPVSFMWLINCLSLARPGFTVRQVPMSLPASRWDSGGQAVVTDGDTKRNNEDTKWSVNSGLQGEYLPAKEPADLFTAPAAENATRFVVGMVAPPAQPQQGSKKRPLQQQAFLQPLVYATPEGVASPTIGGNGRKGGTIRPANGKFMGVKLPPNFAYKTLDVEYRCFAPGQVVITVEIPFPNNNYAPAIFTWKKMCGGSPPTHLNIVTSFDEQVVSAGVVSPEWAAVTGDHKVFPSDVETTFRLSKSRGARQTTRFDTPSVTAVTTSGTGVVCNPALDGSGRKGGTIRAVDKRAPVEIQVLYNCIQQGEAVITLDIPLAMSNEPLSVSWTKKCGGIARQFFTVSTFDKIVTKDGITFDDWSPEYYNEPFSAIIDSSDDDTAFYIALEAVDETNMAFYEPDWADWMDDVEEPAVPVSMMSQTYQRPKIETDNRAICNPSLSGVASKGGTVSSYSDEQQLDVHYHCLRQGEAMVTITIPVGVYADVVFAWKKVCKKEFVTGLSVGLMPQCDGAPCEDVVSDGHAQVLFDTAPSAEGKRMVVDKETKESVFYVQLSGAKGDLDYTEPYISSDPPICSPRVSGVMRKGGELANDEMQTMTVRYNCAAGGSAIITVRMDLEDDALESVTWSWRKNNGPAPNVQSAMDSDEDWENHEVGSLGVLVLGVLVVGWCISDKLKNESSQGFSRLPQRDAWETMAKHS